MIVAGCRVPTAALKRPASPGRQVVKTHGAVLSGLDLRGCYVDAQANDVTLRDCLLDCAVGYSAVRQYDGFSGLSVEFTTFDGLKTSKGAGTAVLGRDGRTTVRDSVFVGLPADAINLTAGEVTGNAIASLGWAPSAHADGIVVPKTTGPVRIASNLIDGTADGAPAGMNHLVQVCPTAGPITHGVEVVTNFLTGGTFSVAVYGAGGQFEIHSVTVRGNVIGRGHYGALYPNTRPGDLVFEGNVAQGTGVPLKI